MIKAIGVTKSYGSGEALTQVLHGIDVTIVKGELVAVMGPSGCGKSTLLNVLSGMDTPDSGEVFIDGRSLHTQSDNARTEFRAQHMGYIFQAYNLIPVLTALENVELPLILGGEKPSAARRRALEMLELVNLANRAGHRATQLSGGQSQRVAVARALVNRPAIVWGDEPTGALDSETAADVMALLVKANRELGQTIVLVTHSTEVADLAHRIIYMRNGSIQQIERRGAVAAGGGMNL